MTSVIDIIIACFFCFAVSIISVSIGGTSLLTVPFLIWLGMNSKNAVATNMFALTFLSLSGALSFKRKIEPINIKMISVFLILTVLGSLLGAGFIAVINQDVLKKIIAVMIVVMTCSLFLNKELGVRQYMAKKSKMKFVVGTILIFILGIYGGFFSGGYIIILTYVLILMFGLDFLQAAFLTKIFNVFSSLAACISFYYSHLIDFYVGIPLAVSMSLGAYWGAKFSIKKGNVWVRNLFVIAVILFAVKLLFF